MSMEPMSLRAYAKHRGVSLRAVQKAIASGRISKRQDGRLDADAADANWVRNTAPRPQPPSKSAKPAPHQNVHRHSDAGAREPSDSPRLETGLEYSRARAVRESYLARLTKIDFEERSRKLVNRDEVQVAAFNKFRQFRDRMLNIPDRVAAMVAAETDAAKCYEVLAGEVRRALNEFADSNG